MKSKKQFKNVSCHDIKKRRARFAKKHKDAHTLRNNQYTQKAEKSAGYKRFSLLFANIHLHFMYFIE
jgi:hypothetical protein